MRFEPKEAWMKVWLVVLGAILFSPVGAQAAGGPPEDQVREALKVFLTSFDNLDWPSFRSCFGPSPTMFHPAAPNTLRVDTEEQFDRAWAGVFERIRRTSGRDRAPYMVLEPKDVRIEFLSPDVALVTLHIVNPAEIDRRTIIFKRFGSAWKIVHIHASNLRTEAEHP